MRRAWSLLASLLGALRGPAILRRIPLVAHASSSCRSSSQPQPSKYSPWRTRSASTATSAGSESWPRSTSPRRLASKTPRRACERRDRAWRRERGISSRSRSASRIVDPVARPLYERPQGDVPRPHAPIPTEPERWDGRCNGSGRHVCTEPSGPSGAPAPPGTQWVTERAERCAAQLASAECRLHACAGALGLQCGMPRPSRPPW